MGDPSQPGLSAELLNVLATELAERVSMILLAELGYMPVSQKQAAAVALWMPAIVYVAEIAVVVVR